MPTPPPTPETRFTTESRKSARISPALTASDATATARASASGADSGLPGNDEVSCRANRSELILLKFIARKPLETLDRIAALFVST